MRPSLRLVPCVVAALVAGGCGAGRTASTSVAVTRAPEAPSQSLAGFVEKTRALSARAGARQPQQAQATTLETADVELAAALVESEMRPSPEAARRVAAAYARHGVFDVAHQFLTAAVRQDPRDAQTHEALARLWRDARLPHLALADAHRAVFFASDWAVAHNTLGTVLQALGRHADAEQSYRRALERDTSAAYVLNNLCYSGLLSGRIAAAMAHCERALQRDPSLRAARNNLGIAQAAAGRMAAAMETFSAGANPAGALYNMGLVRLARREYRSAVDAFAAAQARRPSFAPAAERLRQARSQLPPGPQDGS